MKAPIHNALEKQMTDNHEKTTAHLKKRPLNKKTSFSLHKLIHENNFIAGK
jgi:hypothetical protein